MQWGAGVSVGFSRLQVSGFRRLRKLDLELRPLNVLIGANGVGKSSVLDTFDLLAASADGALENFVSDAGGINSMLTLDGQTDALAVELEMPVSGEKGIQYEISIKRSGIGYSVANEQLTQWQLAGANEPFKFIDARPGRIR
jgi:predicted ATPase